MDEVVLSKILSNYKKCGRDSLIPILQEVQNIDGYLSKEVITKIGDYLKLPVSKIYGVATFYNQFRFQPIGKYHILICRGTACHVKGSMKILETLENILCIKPGHTTKDKLFSLDVVACLGACGLSPVISINGEFIAKVTPKKVIDLINFYREKESKEGGE